MKTGNMKHAVIVLAASAALCGIARAEDKEETITMDQVPALVKEAVAKVATPDQITKVEKDTEDGKVEYEFHVKKDGKTKEVSFSADGKLLSDEEKIELSAAPEAVQKAIKEKAGSGEIKTVEKVTEDGKVTYETHVKQGDKVMEYVFGDDGIFLKDEDVTNEK
jgi:uncharacterized membrane protein YkoI